MRDQINEMSKALGITETSTVGSAAEREILAAQELIDGMW